MSIVTRVNSAYHSPRVALPLAWNSGVFYPAGNGVNPFDVTSNSPNTNGPNGGPYPQAWATGRAGIDGNFTVALTAGFTAPISLVAWEWNKVANAWIRLGANSGIYETTFDATYTMNTFQVSENAYVLIQSTAAITDPAYIDGTLDANTIGARLEGHG